MISTAPKKKNKIKHREGVLLEHMNSQLEQVLEGHTALDKKIDNFQDIDEEIAFIKSELTDIKKQITTKVEEKRIIDLEQRVIRIEKELATRRK